jgi:hypothetical protein
VESSIMLFHETIPLKYLVNLKMLYLFAVEVFYLLIM